VLIERDRKKQIVHRHDDEFSVIIEDIPEKRKVRTSSSIVQGRTAVPLTTSSLLVIVVLLLAPRRTILLFVDVEPENTYHHHEDYSHNNNTNYHDP
jgi:hypothetical protein